VINTDKDISLRRLLALCKKESIQIFRDPSSIIIAFFLPVLLLLIFGYAINLDANKIKVGVVIEDGGAEAESFSAAISGSPYMDVVFSYSQEDMLQKMKRGEVRGIVVIPNDFSAKIEQKSDDSVAQVLTDGAEPNTAVFVANYVQGIWQLWLNNQRVKKGLPVQQEISIEQRYWFNPTTVSRNYLIPGAISIIMTIIGALLTSLVVAREWERGSYDYLCSGGYYCDECAFTRFLVSIVVYY
jgi:ABC-2 type transport system permease protein